MKETYLQKEDASVSSRTRAVKLYRAQIWCSMPFI